MLTLIEQLSPWIHNISADARAKAARLAKSYTMDQERIIHEQVFGETANTGSEDIEMFGDDSDDLDIEDTVKHKELGDNFELF